MPLIEMRATLVAWVAAVAAAWMPAGPLVSLAASSALSSERARPDEILTLVIPSTAPWTDTGIRLGPGDEVQIRTWGRVRFDEAAASVGPKGSGRPGGSCGFVVTDRAVPAQSVVGNVASEVTFDGQGFFVGPLWKGRIPVRGATAREGQLLLGFNDDGMMCDRSGYDAWDFAGDNSGSFTAEVSVSRAR